MHPVISRVDQKIQHGFGIAGQSGVNTVLAGKLLKD